MDDTSGRSFWDVVKSLGASRKFWLAAIGAIVTVVLFAQGAIDAEKLADALVRLTLAVIAGIAIEDGAEKLSRG